MNDLDPPTDTLRVYRFGHVALVFVSSDGRTSTSAAFEEEELRANGRVRWRSPSVRGGPGGRRARWVRRRGKRVRAR